MATVRETGRTVPPGLRGQTVTAHCCVAPGQDPCSRGLSLHSLIRRPMGCVSMCLCVLLLSDAVEAAIGKTLSAGHACEDVGRVAQPQEGAESLDSRSVTASPGDMGHMVRG